MSDRFPMTTSPLPAASSPDAAPDVDALLQRIERSPADDPFALFGLPRAFRIDLAALDARFRQLQSQVHPDRFVRSDPAEQRRAMQASVRVNEAYQTLKAPLARAACLCELRGAPIDAQRNTAMPLAFLQQQLAWREALAEAQDAADADALERLAAGVRAERQRLHAALAETLDATGAEPPDAEAAEPRFVAEAVAPYRAPGGRAEAARRAAELVRALMFVEKFDADLAVAFDAV